MSFFFFSFTNCTSRDASRPRSWQDWQNVILDVGKLLSTTAKSLPPPSPQRGDTTAAKIDDTEANPKKQKVFFPLPLLYKAPSDPEVDN